MPDRDIFDVTVRKGWRAAARVAIAQDCVGEIGEAIETKMVRALKREAIETRLPGFGEVVEIVARYLASPVPANYYSVDDELRGVRARYPWSSTTAVLCESAKRCISGGRPNTAEGRRFACERRADRRLNPVESRRRTNLSSFPCERIESLRWFADRFARIAAGGTLYPTLPQRRTDHHGASLAWVLRFIERPASSGTCAAAQGFPTPHPDHFNWLRHQGEAGLTPIYEFDFTFRNGQMVCARIGPSSTGWVRRCSFPMVVTGNHLSSASDASMLSLVWDFQFVGAAIYAADRLSPSPVTVDCCSYHVSERTLRIPVANVRAWERVASQLEGLLQFMTDDTWALNFVQRDEWAIQSTLFDMVPPADGEIVVLPLSGGLDSLAGIAKAMRSSEDTRVLATTVVTNQRLKAVVEDIQRKVRRQTGGAASRFRWEPVSVGLSYPDENRFFRNSAERARALLYVFSCVAVALRAGG